MILRITDDVSRVAFKITHWPSQQVLADWRNLQLVITPGEDDEKCCHVGGSPWYLYGCWPGKPVGVDVANPPKPDFPAFCINAFELDSQGRVVFILPKRWQEMYYGRYTGQIRYQPKATQPFNLGLDFSYKEPKSPLPPEMIAPSCEDKPKPMPVMAPPKQRCCILAKFFIDFGARCSEHIVDTAAFTFALNDCGLDS